MKGVHKRPTILLSKRMHLLYVSLVLLVVFPKHNACCTQAEQSERKANSFKIGTEITSNWRPFKNIITSLFPQQEVQGEGIFLIRTGDELAIKLLSQDSVARFIEGLCICLSYIFLPERKKNSG